MYTFCNRVSAQEKSKFCIFQVKEIPTILGILSWILCAVTL